MSNILSRNDFTRLSSFIYTELGIKMPETKMTMLTGRLSKRLRALGLASFGDYCNFLFTPQGLEAEMVHLINAVTTNKTDFFREPGHFDFLTQNALPALQKHQAFNSRRPFKIWSAGCSTGEEPYTLAMVLNDFSEQQRDFRFEILATDISTRVLEVARRAVYPLDRIDPVTPVHRKKYLLKGRDKHNPQIRIVSDLRRQIRFGRLNFMVDDFGLPDPVDIIFCRNVIIYFDRPTQEKLMIKFCRYLNPGGFLFLGHSESLHGYETPLIQVAPTVYRKRG
jgi:chemotaxis protein methyltransferase CheR